MQHDLVGLVFDRVQHGMFCARWIRDQTQSVIGMSGKDDLVEIFPFRSRRLDGDAIGVTTHRLDRCAKSHDDTAFRH